MEISFDDIKVFLPKYLSSENQDHLFNELRNFPGNIDGRVFTDYLLKDPVLYQGDCIDDLRIPGDATNRKIIGILISNTCDMAQDNLKRFLSFYTFAPIFSLSKFKKSLSENSQYPQAVHDYIQAIKKQKITQILYLPTDRSPLPEESFARLDMLFSGTLDDRVCSKLLENRKFVLSNYGWYIFLIKLSIHFTRIQEKVDRNRSSVILNN